MKERKTYKVAVTGDTADTMMKVPGVPEFMAGARVSAVIVVVTTYGDVDARNDDPEHATEEDEAAYLMDVMLDEEGTFPDFQARDVTNKAWTVFP